MSDRWQSREERLLDLLADQATFGLSADEQEELDTLTAMMPDIDKDCMQRMVATVHLASVGKELEPLPASLQQRILGAVHPSRGTSSEIAVDRRHPEE
jgi:hypothetical protein